MIFQTISTVQYLSIMSDFNFSPAHGFDFSFGLISGAQCVVMKAAGGKRPFVSDFSGYFFGIFLPS